MRLGVLDVGSNTVHLLLVDAHPGACPLPAYKHKTQLRLAELLDTRGRVSRPGADRLVAFCAEALEVAEDKGAQDTLAFATSALRDAANGEEVISRVRAETGIDLHVLAGEDEARLTFLAARRWYGWSSRRLLCFDIGGGSLEIASGIDEDPDVAVSLPLGAGRLTRDHLRGDPPPLEQVRVLRKLVRAQVADVVGRVSRVGEPDHVVGASKTFRSLARIAGAAPSADGPYVRRELAADDLAGWLPRLAAMTVKERAALPGVSPGRAEQLLAGAVVADAAMDLFQVRSLSICPWALREGLILRRLDAMDARDAI
ncbi:MAG TPA: Ppx/GppA phosphatase family protein [Jiangellales bacterium]|nr:Ppx/GppA phosphatase family protein [Jiangellales bacterium]